MATRSVQRSRDEPGNATRRDAKTPLTPLAGPYGHPIHPMLVPIPIGAWVTSLVFDIASRVSDGGSEVMVEASHWLILVGIVGALAAAVFGLMDLLNIPRRTQAFRTGMTHMLLNDVILVMYVVNFFWRRGDYDEITQVTGGQIALSAVALAMLVVSGWLGGRLSYRYGVRVAREDDQAEAFLTDARR